MVLQIEMAILNLYLITVYSYILLTKIGVFVLHQNNARLYVLAGKSMFLFCFVFLYEKLFEFYF